MIEVKLLGELGRRFGRLYYFDAETPRQIISALSNQLEGFKQFLIDADDNGIAFRVVDDHSEGMSYENLLMPCKRLIIAPIVTGGITWKQFWGGAGKILAGVALVASAFIFAASAPFIAPALFSLGTSLTITGVASLITPSPRVGGTGPNSYGSLSPSASSYSDTQRRDSFLFDRAAELTVQGQTIPILYGRFLAASPLIISSAIATQQVPV